MMDSETDYEALALECLDGVLEDDADALYWVGRAQVYATLHLADVMRPRQELAIDPNWKGVNAALDQIIEKGGEK